MLSSVPSMPGQHSNLPLGIVSGTNYFQFSLRLKQGDLMLIYTDGITEARDANGTMLEEIGLLELVRTIDVRDPGQFMARLRSALHDRLGAVALRDDLTLLLLSLNGVQPPKLKLIERLRAMLRRCGLSHF